MLSESNLKEGGASQGAELGLDRAPRGLFEDRPYSLSLGSAACLGFVVLSNSPGPSVMLSWTSCDDESSPPPVPSGRGDLGGQDQNGCLSL